MDDNTIIKLGKAGQPSSGMGDLALSLMTSVGCADFQDRMAETLKRHIAVDAGLMLLYRRGAAPKILFNDWRTDKGLSDIRAYLQGPYQMDPFYRLALDNGDDGLYRLRQIDPSYDRSQYYRDYYRHSGLHDEFNVFVSIDADTKIAISLARRHAHAAFSPEDQDFLQSAAPLLSMAVLRHFRDLRPESLGDDDGSPLQSALAQAIRNFGRSLLTDRECQVAQMILRGYSVKGAAEKLGISPATVKLHRRNLYAKLDITSQTALFSLFIDAVSSARTAFEDPLSTYLAPGTGRTPH
ncbi:helix-turn-helix transcriptional regulator [Ensifer sp.]|jgi:DNA-binding CsgD family transcriptional regulator|uniref:helix-turn-helix transcriptional regulator n=1 Tax=Ensifer sp. TaxID=1872086 RepID=UPI002E164B11|nr:helix-turn-helix transcriptional regulator [Ensifer sp.]